jgi:hypothetical protein
MDMGTAGSGTATRNDAITPGKEAGKGVGAWFHKQFDKFDTIHVTVFGIALYVMVYFSYSAFYGRFGVSPTEVGLTYVGILTRSAPPLLILLTAFLWVTYVLGRGLLRRRWAAARTRYWIGTLLLAVLMVLVAGSVRAHRLANHVEQGSPVRPRTFGEILDVRVDYVTVIAGKGANVSPTNIPTDDDEPAASPPDPATGLEPLLDPSAPDADAAVRSGSTLEVAKRRALLYLGQANGIVVLYDPLQRQTIRIPIGEVTIFAE